MQKWHSLEGRQALHGEVNLQLVKAPSRGIRYDEALSISEFLDNPASH